MHATLWKEMFYPALPVVDKILRAVIIYIFLVVALKLAGRRELAQLNTFDLVVLLTIANTVQAAIIGPDDSVTGGIIGAATLLAVNYLVVRFVYAHKKMQGRTRSAGEALIENGQVRQEPMKKELITLDELKEAASREGFGSLDEVERAVLNPNGSFAFIGKKKPKEKGSEYLEILNRLDHLQEQLRRVQPAQDPPKA